MPLSPPVTPAEVEEIGALIPKLFNLVLQADLDAIAQGAIDYADAWMQGHMGSSYGLSQFPWQPVLQRRGQIYLALEALCDTIKAEKVYGTHFPYMSEESPEYHALIETEWGQRAMASLDLWVTVEQAGAPFALPIFELSSPIPERGVDNASLEPLSTLYSEILDRARGIAVPDLGTVTR